jgi:hypothetical protein
VIIITIIMPSSYSMDATVAVEELQATQVQATI